MSVHVSSWAWKQKAGDAKLVLLKLADNANDEGIAWPRQERIADECECSVRSIRRKIETLRSLGLVEVERAADKRGRPASYRLLITGQAVRKERAITGQSDRGYRTPVAYPIERTISEPTEANASVRPRKRDILWDIFEAEIGAVATRSERGRRNAALKQLREVGADENTLRHALAVYRGHPTFKDCALTESAIVANWSLLTRSSTNGKLSDEERTARFERRMAEKLEQVSA